MDKKLHVQYSAHARKDLLKLERHVAERVVRKIKDNTGLFNPLLRAEPLAGVFAGMYKYRIGDYRAIFEIDSKGVISILTILRIKHRRHVYE